jgi:hypothetical protein
MGPVDRDVTLETFKQLVCDDSWKKEPTFAREDFLVALRGFEPLTARCEAIPSKA